MLPESYLGGNNNVSHTVATSITILVLSSLLDMHASLCFYMESKRPMMRASVSLAFFQFMHGFDRATSSARLKSLRQSLLGSQEEQAQELALQMDEHRVSQPVSDGQGAGHDLISMQATVTGAPTRSRSTGASKRIRRRTLFALATVAALGLYIARLQVHQVQMDKRMQKACDTFNFQGIPLGDVQSDSRWCRVGLHPCEWTEVVCSGLESRVPAPLVDAIDNQNLREAKDGFQMGFLVAAAGTRWNECSLDMLNNTAKTSCSLHSPSEVTALEAALVNGTSCGEKFSLCGVETWGANNVSLTKPGCMGQETFAQLLRTELEHNTALSSLVLRDAGNASSAVIAQNMGKLSELDLADCSIMPGGAAIIGESLQGKHTLKELNLNSNFLGDKGVMSLKLSSFSECASIACT